MQYEQFVRLMSKLATHPKAELESEFILSYRTTLSISGGLAKIPELESLPDTERRRATASGTRKQCRARVSVTDRGTGKFEINGRGMEDFPLLSQRYDLDPAWGPGAETGAAQQSIICGYRAWSESISCH